MEMLIGKLCSGEEDYVGILVSAQFFYKHKISLKIKYINFKKFIRRWLMAIK